MFSFTRLVSVSTLAMHLLTSGVVVDALPTVSSSAVALIPQASAVPSSALPAVPTDLASVVAVRREDSPASGSLASSFVSASLVASGVVPSVAAAAPSIAVRDVNSTVLQDSDANTTVLVLVPTAVFARDVDPTVASLDINGTVTTLGEATASVTIAARDVSSSAVLSIASGTVVTLDASVAPSFAARDASSTIVLPSANTTVLDTQATASATIVAREVTPDALASASVIASALNSTTDTPSIPLPTTVGSARLARRQLPSDEIQVVSGTLVATSNIPLNSAVITSDVTLAI